MELLCGIFNIVVYYDMCPLAGHEHSTKKKKVFPWLLSYDTIRLCKYSHAMLCYAMLHSMGDIPFVFPSSVLYVCRTPHA